MSSGPQSCSEAQTACPATPRRRTMEPTNRRQFLKRSTPAAAATAVLRFKNCRRFVGSMVLLLGVAGHAVCASEQDCGPDDIRRRVFHAFKNNAFPKSRVVT